VPHLCYPTCTTCALCSSRSALYCGGRDARQSFEACDAGRARQPFEACDAAGARQPFEACDAAGARQPFEACDAAAALGSFSKHVMQAALGRPPDEKDFFSSPLVPSAVSWPSSRPLPASHPTHVHAPAWLSQRALAHPCHMLTCRITHHHRRVHPSTHPEKSTHSGPDRMHFAQWTRPTLSHSRAPCCRVMPQRGGRVCQGPPIVVRMPSRILNTPDRTPVHTRSCAQMQNRDHVVLDGVCE